MTNDEFSCNFCGTLFTVEILEEGNLGQQIDFCPICGNELDNDDISEDNEYLRYIHNKDEDDGDC